MNKMFEGKYAIVTGAARGILKDTALLLAERGAAGILIPDILYDQAVETGKEIESATGCRVFAIKTDLSKTEDVEAIFPFAMEKFGAVHILVNGAGVCPTTPIAEVDAAKWDMVMGINLRSAHLAVREVAPIMCKQKYGRIVNVCSMAVRIGAIAASCAYAASKGGLAAVTRTYAKNYAKFGVTVNNVCPGLILTEMTKDNGYTADAIPLGRLASPRDVSTVIGFLASDDSAYMTGCTLDINGGQFMAP